jgi:hypothetical protein
MNIEEIKQKLSAGVDEILNTYRTKNVNEVMADLTKQRKGFLEYYNLTGDQVFISENAGKCNKLMNYIEKNSTSGGNF